MIILINKEISVFDIINFQDKSCYEYFNNRAKYTVTEASRIWSAIDDNHINNMRLWAEEDMARRVHAPDTEIVSNKRAIDRYNQARNDAVERIDDALVAMLPGDGRQGRLNSETPGSMIDRLSIASLKHFHMEQQTQRSDVGYDHRSACCTKAARISEQRRDLAGCLEQLLAEAITGQAHFRTYRQFKMYNDASLNMALVAETHDAGLRVMPPKQRAKNREPVFGKSDAQVSSHNPDTKAL